jgi:hypothetical protein
MDAIDMASTHAAELVRTAEQWRARRVLRGLRRG